jgi:DNA polymerase-3 subunit delta
VTRAGTAKKYGDTAAVLMISSEPFLLEEAEKELRDRTVPGQELDLNYLMLYGWEAKLSEVLEFLQTLPFLGNRRLLVIREIQKFDEWKELAGYLQDPNPSSLLLMTSSELKRSSALYKSLSRYAETSELRRPYGKAIIKWAVERFRKSGKEVDPQLVEVLLQTTGEDLGILATEIDKVVLSAGERKTITREDLSVSVPGGVEVVFNFLDALGDRDRRKAVSSLRTLLANDSPPEYLIHMMAWHYRQLLRGRELVDTGLSPGEAAVKLGKNFSGLKEKFARQLGRADEGDLVRALQVIADSDRELKRGQIPDGVLLDRLVLELLV